MFKRLGSWFERLSKAGKTGVVLTSVLIAGAAASPATQPPQTSTKQLSGSTQQTQPEAEKSVIQKETVTETEPIAFAKTVVQDANLEKGKSLLKIAGANGIKTLTYEVISSNGTEISKELLSEKVTKEPINEVIAVGIQSPQASSLSCPNGTYTNTYGNVVCRPFESDSVPAGATAKCRDGTYSYSQSRRGTCSHHGGVARWL